MYHVVRQTDKGKVSGKDAWSGAQVRLKARIEADPTCKS